MPTVVLPGLEENPIRMVIYPPGVVTDTQVEAVEAALLEQSGLVVDVLAVERHAEALAALCEANPQNVTVAWLDGLTYQSAVVQDCGEPVLQVERGQAQGDAGLIVVGAESSVVSAGELVGATFCRLSYTDYYGWLVPMLVMQAEGLDPLDMFDVVQDYDNLTELAEAVVSGECDAMGISQTDYDDLSSGLRRDLAVLESAITPALPYPILMYPIYLPLGERLRLSDALLALSIAEEGADVLQPLLGQDGLVRVDASDFADLTGYLDGTGLDFVLLGN